jgi:hypothetical protein
MSQTIEKDIEELSVNIFVNEYEALRAVYNRLYAIIHVYYSCRRQLVASEETLPLEKIVQMRKDMAMRLERVNALTKDEQFPQENFAGFAKEKLKKMRLALGLLETASLMGEFSSYSKTIMDYMKSCCEFAAKFIPVLSDPSNQNLKALRNNLATLLEQIDVVIEQSQASDCGRGTMSLSGPLSREKGKATMPLSGPFSISQMEGGSSSPAKAHFNLDPSSGSIYKRYQIASYDGNLICNVNEAISILGKFNIFDHKYMNKEVNMNYYTLDRKGIDA